MICGPEITKLIGQFESEFNVNEADKAHLHHEEGAAVQKSFKKQTQAFVDTITEFSSPFLDDFLELLVLHSRDCADDTVIATVRSIESIAIKQYQQYCQDVLISKKKSIHDSIKKNSLPTFKTPKCKKKSKTLHNLVVQQSNVSILGRLYIANQQREGDPLAFFSHDNQEFPPSLSDFGNLRLGQKSLLLQHFYSCDTAEVPQFFESKILDGAAVVHFLPVHSARTFSEYAETVFIPFLLQQLQQACRIDCV